ncbi:hypothetical protein D9M68_541800 [compost metagenome]
MLLHSIDAQVLGEFGLRQNPLKDAQLVERRRMMLLDIPAFALGPRAEQDGRHHTGQHQDRNPPRRLRCQKQDRNDHYGPDAHCVQMQDKVANLVARVSSEDRCFAQIGVLVYAEIRKRRDDRIHLSLQQNSGGISKRVHDEARYRIQAIVKAAKYEVGDEERHDSGYGCVGRQALDELRVDIEQHARYDADDEVRRNGEAQCSWRRSPQ